MMKNKWFWVSAVLAVLVAYLYNRHELEPPTRAEGTRVAIVLGGSEPFRERVASGAKEAAEAYGAQVEFIVPEEDVSDQSRRLLRIDPNDFDGIAVSPLEPKTQASTINALANRLNVVTYDNEVPEASHQCHIGTNNYVAGTLCGQLVKEALPDGGELAIFVGTHDRQNAQLRRQGLIDELGGNSRTPGSDIDPLDGPIEAGPYTIVATYLDGMVPAKAKENASRAMKDHPELACMVALYGYNGPSCLQAVKEAEKVGEVMIVAFDDHDSTLSGIEHGDIYATVVQSPSRYGFEAVRVLVELARSDNTMLPYAGKSQLYLPCTAVRSNNLADYKAKLASREHATAD